MIAETSEGVGCLMEGAAAGWAGVRSGLWRGEGVSEEGRSLILATAMDRAAFSAVAPRSAGQCGTGSARPLP
ncbi:hypothetical protein [Streptomyces caniferus]|uniref:hypothetical protein n=1 Tax=Streptomyces caniferus TaxID=285557 RepID=UPI00381BCE48